MENSPKSIDSILAQAGCVVDPSTGGIVQPIHLATTFERDVDGAYSKGFVYARYENPNRSELARILTAIEGGSVSFIYSSGMSAAASILLSLDPGDSVVLPHDLYFGVTKLIGDTPGLSIKPIYVDFSDTEAVARAIETRPRLVWLETPSNPMLQITDIKAVSTQAHANGAIVVVDGTWTTPLLQRPFELGADIVFHSLTKYLSGHSDVLGGAIICKAQDHFSDKLETLQQHIGNVLDPFSCWLTMRGLRTLSLRMTRHCDNAETIASFLAGHNGVEKVFYPGLPKDRGHQIAASQMDRYGAMISFLVDGDAKRAMEIVGRTVLIKRATSLGSTESLLEHRASSEGPDSTTPQNLIRLSVGIEDAGDLVEDLKRALN